MFNPENIALLIPTRDRPQKLRDLLKSISEQDLRPGQILVVASGEDVGTVVQEFKTLSIEYHHVSFSGQVAQRNFGLKKLKENVTLVSCMDDDMVLKPKALSNMLEFWNKNPDYTAICYNICNDKPFRLNIFKYLFQMTGTKPGQVTRAGYNTRITCVTQDIETDWVMGGFTVWKRKILEAHPYEREPQAYAFNEDLYYSYPLRKKFGFEFAVCEGAKVEHHHVQLTGRKNMAFGELQVHARFKLVRDYPAHFSIPLAYWASLGQMLENISRFFLERDLGYLKIALGNLKGIIQT
ncbi:MAG: glycosyltransferase family 2 protein [Deltaproteobacteria bacterium]|nr:glycosyltransferase family 2 protein [Deltaproteobacteria bacterium]